MNLSQAPSTELVIRLSPRPDNIRVVPSVAATGKRQQLSKEQWEVHKNLIRTLYLDENKTFEQVAAELAKHHGFAPTKRQFTRKVAEWGFNKYTKREQRISTMRAITSSHEGQVAALLERTLNRNKLDRRRKQLSKEALVSPASVRSIGVNYSGPSGQPPPDQELTSISYSMEVDNPSDDIQYVNRVPDENIHRLTYLESWACIDLPGSPKMRRFLKFIKLEIGTPVDDIESLVLPGPAFSSPSKSRTGFITGSELANICHRSNITEHHSANGTFINETRHSGRPKHPFKFRFDAWFPSGVELLPSPFNELYVFPTSEEDSPSACEIRSSKTEIFDLKMRECQLRDILQKLQQVCSESRLVISEILEELAFVYYQQNKYQEAETFFKETITIQEHLGLATSKRVLRAQLILNECLMLPNREEEAVEMQKCTHAKIVSLFPSDYDLILSSISVQARIFARSGNFQKSEEVSREGVQRALGCFGPKHKSTMAAIWNLAFTMHNRQSDAEELYSVLVQIRQNASFVSDTQVCELAQKLAEAIYRQGRYSEALGLIRKTYDTAILNLGEEHPTTLRCYKLLGWSLFQNERGEESEEILNRSVFVHLHTYGEQHMNTILTIRDYGNLLYWREKYEEATTVLMHAFSLFLNVLGPTHASTISCCDNIAKCYEAQYRWEEALSIVEDLDAKIRTVAGDRHPELKWTHSEIIYFQEKINTTLETDNESLDDSDEIYEYGEVKFSGESNIALNTKHSNNKQDQLTEDLPPATEDEPPQDDVISQWTTL